MTLGKDIATNLTGPLGMTDTAFTHTPFDVAAHGWDARTFA
jgi:CubicO group peptidase (beta-lactamase class C family)